MEIIIDDNPLGRKKDNSGWEDNWDFRNLKYCDIVFVNNISNFGGPYTVRVVGKAKEMGKFVQFDTDDLLHNLYPEHRLYETYKTLKLDEITKFIYFHSDLVTVTQNKFAERVKPFCSKFLAVIKNAIDYTLPGWNVPKKPSKKCRIGYMAGVHHVSDLEQFKSVPHLVNQKCGVENIVWALFGHPPPNQPEDGKWQLENWKHYMDRFLGAMKGNKNYSIHMALPPSDYGVYYSELDISIAPLAKNEFNDSKCFGAGEKVILFDGNIKKVEDIKEGDILLGPDSKPRKVLSTTTGEDYLWTIVPNRGKPFKVTKEHILRLKTNDAACLKYGKPQYLEISCENYLSLPKSYQTNYRLYRTKIDFFDSQEKLELDPYFLGIMIGDGTFTKSIKITTMDDLIQEYFSNYCMSIDSDSHITVSRKKNNKAATFGFSQNNKHSIGYQGGRPNKVMKIFRDIGLGGLSCGDKFIPHKYKVSTRENRLQLLAGLIDTDGHLGNKTFFGFTNKSRQLVEDTAFIARSLGLYVSPIEDVLVPKICDTTYYRIRISGNTEIVPCRLDRKKADSRKCNRDPLTSGFKIIKGNTKEKYYGFKVDGDGLFLLDDFIVTHNSDIKVAEAGRYSIPLVATNIGCYSDTIENGKTGYLIDPDAPKTEWVRILTKLVKDKKLREEMGRNLHAKTEELFDLNKVVGQRLKIYEEVFKVIGDPRKNRNKEPNND